MPEAQYLFLTQPAREVTTAIDQAGPIECSRIPPISLRSAPVIEEINNRFHVTLACEYDPANSPVPVNDIRSHLETFAIGLQMVRPVDEFSDYWVKINTETRRVLMRSVPLVLPENLGGPTLAYQQHHATRVEDVQRVIGLLPLLSRAMELHHGSWTHPCASIHRAIVFFSQGYSVGLDPLPQLCWAAGLDSLFASKLNRRLQGSREISRRMQAFFGANFEPYQAQTVRVPGHQFRPQLRLSDIAEHIFWLRNANVHGGPIPDQNWLSNPHDSPESGYAYQLMECSEILLRESLLRLLEDQVLFETFLDPVRLDAQF
jgi:hypothetical protein